MKKALFTGPYTIEFQEVEIPSISADEVLLKIISVGVCGSDVQMYHGLHPSMKIPVVPGHEVSAVIEKAGDNVTDFQVGERVTVEPQIFCKECYPCTIGRFNVCESLKVKGCQEDGFLAEYVAIEPSYLHHCPQDMDFDLITLVEPLAVGVGSVKRSSYKGANVVVVGAGTIGNLTAQAAQVLGAGKVMITDVVDSKLEYAKQCGIEYCVNIKEKGLSKAIEDTFGIRKADVIIDAAATKGSFISILEASRSSSEIIITGNYKEPMELVIPRIQRREVSLIGHMMYVREDYQQAIRFLYEKIVKVDGFISKRFSIEQFPDAFKYLDEHPGEVLKAVIDINRQ